MNYDPVRALELLRQGSGNPDATFRDGQEEAIRHLVEGRGRLLVVQKTGWGKSFVYFVAAKLLREANLGPALLVSPLLALMRNQISAAERMGVRAATLNSGNTDEWDAVEADLLNGNIDMLLVSPERFANERFRDDIMARIAATISLLVIDEAHCISDWGHDFRPHYRLLERLIRVMPANLRLLATTATANDRVMDDLAKVLGPKLESTRGDLNRPSLTLQTITLPTQAERLAWIAENLATLQGHGIIYTLTVRDAEMVAAWLKSRNFKVEAYTGDSGDLRIELEDALLKNRVKALVATTALGMGYDKPDLAFVIHYQMPGSVVAYYQQVGRAGRALPAAYGILLSGKEEADINEYFISSAFPSRQDVDAILKALQAHPDGLSTPDIMAEVNISKGRIDKALAMLSLESPAPLAKSGTKWRLTAARLSNEFWERADRLTSLRRDEYRQMRQYVHLPFGEHMPFLIRALDGDPDAVEAPKLPPLSETIDPRMKQAAVAFLRQSTLDIEPRKMWPAGGLPLWQIQGKIAAREQMQPGKALCTLGDSGWGELVRRGRRDGHFSDELVEACAQLYRDWNPNPAPRWVTALPSLRRPELVRDFATRLAAAIDLPFRDRLIKTEERPEQKTQANGTQQARNVDGSLARIDRPMPKFPVLLVDDTVDSRWTLTIATWLLRDGGCGEVWPLVLAQSGHDE